MPHAERAKPPSTLSDTERDSVLAVINSAAYADLSICQIWARELDEDRYHCSMSSMYLIARSAGQTRERRRLASHPAKVKPELLATGPSQVWSWDITKLRGPGKGVWFHLYALIDIYSRYSPGYLVCAAEDSVVAADFIDDAIAGNGTAPHTVHADRSTSGCCSGRGPACRWRVGVSGLWWAVAAVGLGSDAGVAGCGWSQGGPTAPGDAGLPSCVEPRVVGPIRKAAGLSSANLPAEPPELAVGHRLPR